MRTRRSSARGAREDDKNEASLKRLARRRLIGAFILVCAMVIVLPLVFDAVPKGPEPELDITIQSSAAASTQSSATSNIKNAKSVGNRLPYEGMISEGEEIISQNTSVSPQSVLKDSNRAVSTNGPQANSVSKNTSTALNTPNENHGRSDGASKGVATNKVFLKAGVFASEERALKWFDKLKAAKLPAQMERKKTSEGDRYFLRVGPFADRAAAEAAQKKVQMIGLPSIISESH